MPIYEFFCDDCNVIFTFFSRSVNTSKRPDCPKCHGRALERMMSTFAMTGKAQEPGDGMPSGFDETKLEQAFESMAGEAEGIDENDPRQAARFMRKLSESAGINFGDGINEAVRRMEAGEDPDSIEADMGDVLESEDPSTMFASKKGAPRLRRNAPVKDDNVYEL